MDVGGCGCYGSVVEMVDRWVKVVYWLQIVFIIFFDQGIYGWKVVVQWIFKIIMMIGLYFFGYLY